MKTRQHGARRLCRAQCHGVARGDASRRAAAWPRRAAVQPLTSCCVAPGDRTGGCGPLQWRRQRRATTLPTSSVPRVRKVGSGRAVWWSRPWKAHASIERRPRQGGMGSWHIFLWRSQEQALYYASQTQKVRVQSVGRHEESISFWTYGSSSASAYCSSLHPFPQGIT
jgi:hypothetical protein